MPIQQHRYSSAVTETIDVARVRHFTYNAVTNTLTIAWEAGELSGQAVVAKKNGTVVVDSDTLASYPNVVTVLETLVSRMLTYLENTGVIPAGAQEDIPSS